MGGYFNAVPHIGDYHTGEWQFRSMRFDLKCVGWKFSDREVQKYFVPAAALKGARTAA